MQQLRELCLNEPRQWDYKPIKPGWRMSHDDWDRLFLANLRRPWPQHITARQERGRVMNADSDVQRQKVRGRCWETDSRTSYVIRSAIAQGSET